MESLDNPSEQKPDVQELTLYGIFSLAGHDFASYMPSRASQPQEWTLTISKDGEIVRQQYLPMDYEPRFGPDVSDVQRLNECVEVIISELMLGV